MSPGHLLLRTVHRTDHRQMLWHPLERQRGKGALFREHSGELQHTARWEITVAKSTAEGMGWAQTGIPGTEAMYGDMAWMEQLNSKRPKSKLLPRI